MHEALSRLLPTPRRLTSVEGYFQIEDTRPLGIQAPEQWLRALECFLPGAWVQLEASGPVRVEVEPELDRMTLTVHAAGITIQAPPALLAPSAATAAQLLRLAERGRVPCCHIEDWPALARRGYMQDISRDRVPTMEELHGLIDLLGSLKYDHLQLYVEHTFAYPGHEEAWAEASPLTAEEVQDLDAHAQLVGIELTANQNCLGHMHRWLTHPRYAPLAECPEGIEHAFSVHKEPFSLCPTDPASLEFALGLLDQLLPCHTSDQVNVGLDETFDLGLGRSRGACEERGKGRVYLEYLTALHAALAKRSKRMQFWGDIIVQHPELVPELPRDAVALEWGYEDGHPFEAHGQLFASSGLPFWVVPGTSTWQSMLGRPDNMLANVEQAVGAALRHGAEGGLMTDWGDYGHWQPPCTTWPGILAFAARAWNPDAAGTDLAASLDLHVPASQGLGNALLELGLAHRALRSPAVNGTSPFFHLRYAHAEEVTRAPDLTVQGLADYQDALTSALQKVPAHNPQGQELEAAAAIARVGTRLARARTETPTPSIASLSDAVRKELREDLHVATELHREAWTLRSRPGGLRDSCARLESVRSLLA